MLYQRRPKGPSQQISFVRLSHTGILTPKNTLFIQLGVALIHQLPYTVVSCSQSCYCARFFYSRGTLELELGTLTPWVLCNMLDKAWEKG